VFVLPGPGGYRLFMFDDTSGAESVQFWDGTATPPVVVFQTNTPPGEVVTGVVPLGNFGYLRLSSNDGSRRTTTARAVRWNGSAYTNGATMTLPSAVHFAAQANVMLFQGEPFVANAPELLAQRSASDWSSG